jgi:hypothetical protein
VLVTADRLSRANLSPRRRSATRILALVAGSMAWPGAGARAQAPEPDPPAPPTTEASTAATAPAGSGWAPEGKAREWAVAAASQSVGEAKQKDKGKDKAGAAARGDNRVEVGGRVFFRTTWSRVDLEAIDDDPWDQKVAVDSARITADYRHEGWLKVSVEAELADADPSLKDGYLRLRPGAGLTVKAGRFKVPMSAIALESSWGLPPVERGVLSSLEPSTSAALPFGGRADGLAVEYALERVALAPRLTASVFGHQMSGVTVDVSEHFALDPYFRVALAPAADLDLGLSLAVVTHQKRASEPDALNHAPVVGADLTYRRGAVEVWLEGFFGQSTVYTPAGVTGGDMAAARAIVSAGVDDPTPWLGRLAPFATGSLFDPDLDRDGDRGTQLGAGVVARFDKRCRFQLEVEQTWIDDVDLLLASDRLAFLLQLGAAF